MGANSPPSPCSLEADDLDTICTSWQTQGDYQYEYNRHGYTGWCRCVNGRQADGHWPEWNNRTGEQR